MAKEKGSFEFKRLGVERLVVGPLEVNCYIVWDRKTKDAAIVDPGGDAELIEEEAEGEGLNVVYIINTHGHFDHVGADSALRDFFGAKVAIHPLDAGLLETTTQQSRFFGFDFPAQPRADVLLLDGEKIKLGGLTLEILHTPGHTEGGICLSIESEGVVFTGDTLFAGSVGRTDLSGGSFEKLMDSIRNKILSLGDGVKVFPGHGPTTTVREEKLLNPFVKEVL